VIRETNTANALGSLNSFQPRFDHGYTGQEHMAGFGLINFNGRLYDPYQQMFVSPEPTVPHVDNPLSYNRYTYCLNNPLRYIDPSGYCSDDPDDPDPCYTTDNNTNPTDNADAEQDISSLLSQTDVESFDDDNALADSYSFATYSPVRRSV